MNAVLLYHILLPFDFFVGLTKFNILILKIKFLQKWIAEKN